VLTLGQRIRRAREARHQTQVRLAAEAVISQGYLSQLEQDEREPTLSIAARQAGALAWPLPGPFSLRNFSKNPNLATAPRGPVLCSGSAAMSRSAAARNTNYSTDIGILAITAGTGQAGTFTVSAASPSPVPEIDPATGGSALSLVAGLLAMVEQRRRRSLKAGLAG